MRLNNGDLFPCVRGPIVGGTSLTIPKDLRQEWDVVLFYRGHWWPFCNLQLADFSGPDLPAFFGPPITGEQGQSAWLSRSRVLLGQREPASPASAHRHPSQHGAAL